MGDYRNVPFWVCEFVFSDESFASVKGKRDELFIVLFHRRFAVPELAYSETTAFPADKLSARNVAAKLAISTTVDVRNTIYMSGMAGFPREHWETPATALRRQAELHLRIAGHRPRGPFLHYWGESSRHMGDDRPYSRSLAAGVPFDVVATRSEWAFLSDADATSRTRGVSRRSTPETLAALFGLKKRLCLKLHDVPWIEDDLPAACA